jgi:drug/metabolite transporter (DMT)-like permease
LLILGVRLLGEPVGRREIAGVVAIVAGIAALGWVAPAHTGAFTRTGKEVAIVWLAAVVVAPYVLRALHRSGGLATSILAGLGWGWVGIGTALVDAAIGDRHWLVAAGWGACVAGASWGTLLSEMTALQRWPATRAIPVSFALEMAAPAAAAPALTRHGAGPWHGIPFALALLVACAGAALLGASRPVARAVVPDPLTEP